MCPGADLRLERSRVNSVDRDHLLPIPDLREWYPSLGFSHQSHLVVESGDKMLVTDPIYLADIYNLKDDTDADYIRKHGVVVSDFGGDTSCPMWWCEPWIILPTSSSIDSAYRSTLPATVDVLASEVGCDSASFVFMTLQDGVPRSLINKVDSLLRCQNGVAISLLPGCYQFYLEQQPGCPQANMAGLYRNIVAERQR